MNSKAKRIAPPEFWRFVCILYVFLYHFDEDVYEGVHLFTIGAHPVVDFYLMLSGFAVAYSYNKKPITLPLRYGFEKAKKIYPDFLFAILLMFALWLVYDYTDWHSLFVHIYERRLQFFLINAFIWTPFETGPLWFISFWLVGIIVLVYVLNKRILFVVGFLVISYFSWHYFNIGCLQEEPQEPNYLWNPRLIRCVSMTILGAMTFDLMKAIDHIQLSSFGKFIFSLLEIFVVGYALYILSFSGGNHVDYYAIACFAIIIVFSFWRQTWLSHLLDNRLSVFLGSLSLPVFLYHPVFEKFLIIYFHNNSHKLLMYIVVIVGTLFTSWVFHYFVEHCFSPFLKYVCHKMVVNA